MMIDVIGVACMLLGFFAIALVELWSKKRR
jgi:hypothetical protein